jgi:hypothetical protein
MIKQRHSSIHDFHHPAPRQRCAIPAVHGLVFSGGAKLPNVGRSLSIDFT